MRYYADCLTSLCYLSRTTKLLESAIGHLDALQEAEQNHEARDYGGLLSHNNNNNNNNLLLIERMKGVIQNAMHTG